MLFRSSEKWLQRLRETMSETKEDIAERFDAKPASGEIFVYTPNGDKSLTLPVNVTRRTVLQKVRGCTLKYFHSL